MIPINSFSQAFGSGHLTKATAYPGIRDGLYEVNGTYGGCPGFEVMAQMIGSAMTFDAWLLMVLLTICIATGLAIFMLVLEVVQPRNILGLPMLQSAEGMSLPTRAARTGNIVLRLVLSYVTMPLVALSSYQFYHRAYLGAGHFTFAIIVLSIILLALVWLAIRHSPASLGALVLENGYRYHRVRGHNTPTEALSYHDHAFIMVLLVLNLIRGPTIGGLQGWGVVQLALLAACEVVMLLAVRLFGPYPFLSSGFAVIPLRLALLACFVPFAFAPSRLFTLKAISAFFALCLCGLGIFAVFFLPSCWRLYHMFRWGLRRYWGNNIGQVGTITLQLL